MKNIIKKIICLLVFITFYSCTSMYLDDENYKIMEQTYNYNYDKTWEAALEEMSRFPIKNTNQEGGIIITEQMTKFVEPEIRDSVSSRDEISYNIELKVSKVDENITKVMVKKYSYKITLLGPKMPYKPDYIDENIILYRIERILKRNKI